MASNRIFKRGSTVLTRVSASSGVINSSSGNLGIGQDEDDLFSGRHLGPLLSRTSLLILDYKQFKAARTIQAAVRGWLVRTILTRKCCAAIIIQRDWRRYSAMQNYYKILEETVQKRIDEYHNKSAVKVQSLWRGFWVREHIHNQFRMKRSQRMAASDLLQCIAHKLHHLLRTYHIPGVYSLRNSNAFSKVEKLLISISFKQANQRTFVTRLKREAEAQKPKKYFNATKKFTHVPYAGPNFSGLCEPKCADIYKEPNIDARMHQVLRMYEEGDLNKCAPKQSKISLKQSDKPKTPADFCGDVVKSMRRWNIVAPNKFEVRKDIFKNPENVAEFLTEIDSMYEFMMGNCYCQPQKSCNKC